MWESLVITKRHEALRKDVTVTRKKQQKAGRKIGVTEVAGGIIRQLADVEIENIIDSVDSNRVVGRHRGPLLFYPKSECICRIFHGQKPRLPGFLGH